MAFVKVMLLSCLVTCSSAGSVEERVTALDADFIVKEIFRQSGLEGPSSPKDVDGIATPTNSTAGCSGQCRSIARRDDVVFTNKSQSNDTSFAKEKSQLHFRFARAARVFRRDIKVIGGTNANAAEFPWQARISFNGNLCGGVLVHGCYVLTAKHCAQAAESAYTVILGDRDRTVNEGTEQIRGVLKIFRHPSYDAALLLLKTGTDTSVPHVKRVPVLATSLPPVGTTATVTGWGWFMSNTPQAATILQKLSLPVASSSLCAAQLNPILAAAQAPPLQPHELCAGNPAGNYANACHGDSGGPLVWFDGTSWQLIGIVSRGAPGCPSNVDYAIYLSVPSIRSWILSYLPANIAAPGASCACLHPAIRYLPSGTTLQYATWDGANCYLGPAKQGCGQQPNPENKAFIYQNRYYVSSLRAIDCPNGPKGHAFSWDSCNCFMMTIPAGVNDFIYANKYYVGAVGGTCPVIGSWDTANCHVESAPWGTTAFKWGQNWYSTARPTCNTPFSFDGANCLYQVIPPGGFIWNNCYYVPTISPGVCPPGSSFDGANCFLRCAPWATSAFAYNGKWYHTPRRQCDTGSFDGANCLEMTPPYGATAFEWQQKWYYGW